MSSNNKHSGFSRRQFLQAAASAVGATAAPFALNLAAIGSAAAASSTGNDYKALVCVFLAGGNDPFNTLLATDLSSWSEYVRLRTTNDSGSIALPYVGANGGVLPIAPTTQQAGRTFALHPAMAQVRDLFNSGNTAIIANVGTLMAPTTKAQYKAASVPLPAKLFSHNDQQSMWQAYAPEGARVGWGGRMAEMVGSGNTDATFTAISTAGSAVFLAGRNITQYQISDAGAVAIRNINGNLFGAKGNANPLKAIVAGQRSDMFEKEHAAVVSRSINAQITLSSAMAPVGPTGVVNPTLYINPNTGASSVNPLALQLQTVARIIAARTNLGAKRQVFYVSLGGFDTHDFQKTAHADLLAKLAHGMAYFDSVMTNLQGADLRQQVTLFTASEFGRTFASNGDGTDHGWGSHHFVMGGAVKGKNIYGKVPVTGVGHELDIGSGALLPTIAVDQYAATLGTWFGLSTTQINDVFPNLGRFDSRNLGFMV